MASELPLLTLLDGIEMIKPDYIPFSQEIFDECEALRHRLLGDDRDEFCRTAEYAEQAIKLADCILSREYGKYLDGIQKK